MDAQRKTGGLRHEVLEALGLEQALLPVHPVDRRVLEKPVGQPAAVSQQVLDRDGTRRRDLTAVLREDGRVRESGDELRHRVVERDVAALDQHHDRRAGDRLGHRVDAKDVVSLERVARRDVAHSDRFPEHEATPAGDHRHHARQLPGVDQTLHRRPDERQIVRGHGDFGRRSRRQR